MKSQIVLRPSSQYRTIQVSILHNSGYSKFPLIPLNSATLGSSTKTYPIKTYMPIQNVSRKISHLQHRNSRKKFCSRERSTQYRPSCNGNESNQHIAGERSEFSAEIAEGSVVEIVESKENVSNDKGKNVSEEGHAENLSVYTAKYEDFEESSVHGFNFVEKWQSMWQQMKEIAMFAGPALGIWLCGPLMSLIDTAVIGQSSSLELAALGPGTVVCDNLSYVFMFLPIATSNIVATSLARKDEVETQQQLSRLLFVALACGIGMLLFTKAFGTQALHAFVGSKNASLVPAANTYVQIRGLAWPAVLVGMVAQSASLGMKDSWGPLKVLFVASLLNGFGDIILCSFRGYGIAGAAWATMFSQIVAALMMLGSVNKKGYNAFALSVPSSKDLIQIVQLAAPVFISLIIRVAFFSIITYFVTSMGPDMLAAHQVMIGVFSMCTIFGEPLSQTAQSFMPTLIHGVSRNLKKARSLLQSLVAIGAVTGFTLGCIGTLIAWVFPHIFTRDTAVISQMHQVIVPFFIGLIVSPSRSSLEGSLLAGRDMNFLSYATTCCFCIGCLLLLIYSKRGLSLQSCWWIFACFQWARFSFFYKRLTSFSGPLYDRNTLI